MFCRFLVTLLAFAPTTAAAQEALTVDSAVKAALAHNASLRAVRAGVDEASARVTQAQSGFFPRISFSESWQRGDNPVYVFSSLLSARRFAASNFAIDALNHPDATAFFRSTVGVEQLLFDGGRVRAAARAAELQHAIAASSADEASATLAVNTTQTFGRVVSAEAARRAAEAGVATAREDLARAERRRDAGMATDADVLALVVLVADLQQRAIQAEGDAAAARADLNRLMGNLVDVALTLVEPSNASIDEVGDHPDVNALLAEADAARPELKRAQASERLSQAASRQARTALIPQVAAQGAVDVSGTQFNDRASSWIAGGELRWTFSAGGGELAGIKAAAASIVRTQAEADETRAAVHVDVVSALSRLQSARARLQVARATIDQAHESQRIVRDRFDAGIAPVNDVLRTAGAVLDADANRVAALVDAMVATAMLRRALGRTP